MPLTPVLSRYWDEPESWTLDTYRRHDGYEGLQKALRMDPDEVISTVKEAGLRGRGGAGFPTGMKWSFIPQGDAKPHYLVVNADESEPGTCKDMPLILATPHALVEGVIIAAYAIRAGHRLKFWTPGGSSTPIFTDEHLDVALDYEGVGAAGSMLGTKALQIFDETTCVVRAVLRWTEFYAHESCGKCTPCREGTYWLVQILERLERGEGTDADLEKLLDIADNILGKSFCALGDGAASPIMSSIKYFRDEYLAHFEQGGCPFDPHQSTLMAGVHA